VSDLVEWLRARLDEDEATARAAAGDVYIDDTGARWSRPDPEYRPGRIVDAAGCVITYDEGSPADSEAEHIARWDPARVLSEVAARRATLALHVADEDSMPDYLYCSSCGGGGVNEFPTHWPCDTVKLLALPYADQPGFDPAWRLNAQS
jgi:hypothetical protein